MRKIILRSVRWCTGKKCALLGFAVAWLVFVVSMGDGHAGARQAGLEKEAAGVSRKWPESPGVTVFIYHRFGEEKYPSTNVEVQRFREQMVYLRENGYTVMPLGDLVNALHNRQKLPEKSAVITIDDGYGSVYEKAWPILREFKYPFTVFLYVKAIDQGYGDYMSWDQVKELRAAGVDFQDHGYSHQRFGSRPTGMDDKAWRGWIRADLFKSSAMFQEKLGYRPRHLALPYGEYNSMVIEEARKLGYGAVLVQDGGSVSEYTDPFVISREPILGNDWSTMSHFKTVLERVDLPLAAMEPAITPLPDSVPERFSARLLHPDRYVPSSLEIYVSELGWLKAALKGDRISAENALPLSRRLNRVAVRGREKHTDRTAMRFWLLIRE